MHLVIVKRSINLKIIKKIISKNILFPNLPMKHQIIVLNSRKTNLKKLQKLNKQPQYDTNELQ